MRVHVNKKFLTLFILLGLSITNAYAGNVEDAIEAYKTEDYKSALKLLNQEIKSEPENYEAFKWLAKTYEAMFEIEKSLQAYKEYERLKRNSEQITLNPSVNVTDRPIAVVNPTVKPTYIPKVIPTVKPTLAPMYKGWENIKVIDSNIKDNVKIIPKNSIDMVEINEKSEKDKKFFWVKCKVKYNKNIIIKQNSDQISLVDDLNNYYPLYAMSTYKFNYGGNKASQKLEVLLVSDYYELSKKDSRNQIQLLFKINKDRKIKKISIKGYGDITL